MSASSRFAEEELAGWGRWPRARARRYRPEAWTTVDGILAGDERRLIARGGGRAYGDAAIPVTPGDIADPCAVVDLTRLNRFLHFDPTSGTLMVEAGVTLDELLRVVVPRGWLPPVLPGTRFCTIGGMVGCDVHGKNHPTRGSFQDAIETLVVQLATGEIVECSRESRPDLFAATCGGLGLTGLVREVRLRLRPIETSWVRTKQQRVNDIAGALEALREPDHEYSVAWLDGFDHAGPGRAIVHHADLLARDELDSARRGGFDLGSSAAGLSFAPPRSLSVPRLPFSGVNSALARLHNTWRWWRAGRMASTDYTTIAEFFFPLDRLHQWGRLYGPRGFQQYQCQLPEDGAVEALTKLFVVLRDRNHSSYLTVLKRFGGASGGHGMLSFPAPGVTVSFDFPNKPELADALTALDDVVMHQGGRVYLAKDARLGPQAFVTMYPDRDRFLEIKREVDPRGSLESALSRRVGLTGVES